MAYRLPLPFHATPISSSVGAAPKLVRFTRLACEVDEFLGSRFRAKGKAAGLEASREALTPRLYKYISEAVGPRSPSTNITRTLASGFLYKEFVEWIELTPSYSWTWTPLENARGTLVDQHLGVWKNQCPKIDHEAGALLLQGHPRREPLQLYRNSHVPTLEL